MSNGNQEGSGLRVIVVGAGIAGLAAAIALRRQGHSVQIHERSHFNTELGAGIVLATNVTRMLDVFGIEETNLHPVETKINKMYNHDKAGDPFSRFSPAQAPGSTQYPSYQVHRVDLHNELKRLALSEEGAGKPCELILGSHIIDCDTFNASVTLASREFLKADLVIVAEGVKSNLRKRVCEEATEPTISGFYAHRFTIPMDEEFRKDPAAQWILEELTRVTIACDTGSRRIVFYPIRDAKVLNFAALCDVSVAPYLANIGTNYDSVVSSEALLETFGDFHERYLYPIKLAAAGSIRAWPLLKVEPLPTWVKGNVVLVGDAAHPMWPHAAQGGAQGLEDAAALGVLLPKDIPITEINNRLHLFEETRRERCTTMQLSSFMMATQSPLVRGEKQTTDHFRMALAYDAVTAARQALARNLKTE